MPAPNLKEIENGIYELEHEESSQARYALLAALYTCRNEMLGLSAPQPQTAAYSEAAAPAQKTLDQYGDSDFLRAVSGLPADKAWEVIDELMDTLQLVNPRLYDSAMRKLDRL